MNENFECLQRIARLEEREVNVKKLQELVDIKLDALDKALGLQAKEYDRRLAALNDEAGRLVAMQTHYLSREVYEMGNKEITNKVEWTSRMLYMGIGGLLVIEFILRYLTK